MINLEDAAYHFHKRCEALKKVVKEANNSYVEAETRYSLLYRQLYDNLIKQTFKFEYQKKMSKLEKLNLDPSYSVTIKSEIFNSTLSDEKTSVWNSDRENFNYDRDLRYLEKHFDKKMLLKEGEIEGLVWYWGPDKDLEDLKEIVSSKVFDFLKIHEEKIKNYLNDPDKLNDI